MSRSSGIVYVLGRVTGGRQAAQCRRRIGQMAEHYSALGDDALVDACRMLIDTPKVASIGGAVANDLSLRRLAGYELDDAEADALALGAEAFSRFPPIGLARGTRLYDQQVLAAVHLLRGALVQMDTGEGKTFAIMMAAFALLRRHTKVYVVTANPYLAMRDANKSAPFWARLGVRVGLALPPGYPVGSWPGWDATVVYTIAERLVFATMEDTMAASPADRRIEMGAVLLDEADAILLEQLPGDHKLVRNVAPATKDWSEATRIALELDDVHVRRDDDSLGLSAILTPSGEAEVVRLAGRPLTDSAQLRLFRDVELAYTGLRVAVDGHNYEVVGDVVIPIDAASGWRTPGRHPQWLAPLEQHLGKQQRPRTQCRHVAEGIGVLRRFPHIGGASGTLLGEALEYVLLLGLPVVVVRPRVKRYDGRLRDSHCRSITGVERHLKGVVQDHGESRPILVVTGSTNEAQRLAATLGQAAPPGVHVRFASGETIAAERLFEDAGRPGVVIVSTRVAGRGVDIQLNDVARANDGTVLVAVGHARETRLDRQLLGRVGRTGDPYMAWFVNHLDDDVISIMARGKMARKSFDILGDDLVVENRVLDKGIAQTQRVLRRLRMQSFASQTATRAADTRTYELLDHWRNLLQASGTPAHVGDPFVDALATAYCTHHLPGLGHAAVTEAQTATVAATVANLLGHKPDLETTLRVRLTGQLPETAHERIRSLLVAELSAAVAANRAVHDRANDVVERNLDPTVDLGLLADLRERLDEVRERVAGDGVGLATDEVAAPSAVRVSGPRAESRRATYAAWSASADGAPVEIGELSRLSGAAAADDSALAALIKAVTSLEQRDEPPTPPELETVSDLIVEAEQARVARADALRAARWIYQHPRTTRHVAEETISSTADLLITANERGAAELAQRQLSPIRYQHAYSSLMDDLRRRFEAQLIEELCRNLLLSRDPDALDVLMQARDHAMYAPQLPISTGWQPPPPPVAAPFARRPAPLDPDQLVLHFAEALRARLGKRAPSKEELLPALTAVLADSPLATLSEPGRVGEALERWRRHEVRRRLLPWRRRRIDRHVREFLTFLYERGLAAQLPTGLQARSRALLARLSTRVKTPRLAIAVGFVLVAATVAMLLGLVHGTTLELGPTLGMVDRVLAGGTLGGGLGLGVALLATTGAAMVTWLIAGVQVDRGAIPYEKLVFVGLAIAASLALTEPWRGGAGLAAGAGLAVAFLVGAYVFRNSVWMVENLGQLRVTAGLVAVFLAISAVPGLAGVADSRRPVAVALLGAAVQLVATPFRRANLMVKSLQVGQPDSDDLQRVPRKIVAPLGWSAHVYALVAAWLVAYTAVRVEDPVLILALEAGVYLAVLLFLAGHLAGAATRHDSWATALRKANQSYSPTAKAPDLAAGLRAVRRRLWRREVVIASVSVALAVVAVWPVRQAAAGKVPVALAALCFGVAALQLGGLFVNSLRNTIFLIGATVPDDADDPLASKLSEDARDVMRRFARSFGIVIGGFLILKELADWLSVWELLVDVFHWVQRLLP